MDKRNLEMIADFYEFTMSNGYFQKYLQHYLHLEL